jgi:hypothetical protein
MTKLAVVLLVVASTGCASRVAYSTVYDASAVAEWQGGVADRCVFGAIHSTCFRGVVALGGSREAERFVIAGIRQHIPGFQSRCDSADRNEVLAHIAPNACIDCGPDFKLPLTASASVTALQAGIGQVDSVQWIDERGGSLEQVATRVGAAVGEFIVSAARQCGPPAQPR